MSIEQLDVGDVAKISAVFTSTTGSFIDPTGVSLIVDRPPGGDQIVLAYPATITKDSTGHYHADVPVDQAGDWQFKWVSTGTGAGAEEGWFVVRRPGVVLEA